MIDGSIVVSVGGWGEGGGYLAAYHADNGSEAWRYLPQDAGAQEHEQESLQFLAYDGELQMLYLAVWTPMDSEAPYFSCPRLVAIQAQSGEYLWELPAAASPVRICNQHATALVDLAVEGRMKALLIQSLGVSGLNLVDRVTGQVIAVDGQPAVKLSQDDASARETVVNGAGCERPPARLPLSSAMAVDPINKLVFLGLEGLAESNCDGSLGYLLAWDPLAREPRWRVNRLDLTAGLLATGGNLLFQAAQSELVGYHSSTGEKRWSYPLEATSAPISFQIDGRQYLAVVAAASEGEQRPQLMVFTLAEPDHEIIELQDES